MVWGDDQLQETMPYFLAFTRIGSKLEEGAQPAASPPPLPSSFKLFESHLFSREGRSFRVKVGALYQLDHFEPPPRPILNAGAR